MIFSSLNVAPAACLEVSVRTNAKVCAVNMRVRTIGMNHVRTTKLQVDTWEVLAERIDIDSPSNRFHTLGGSSELIEQPALGHATVSIGIRYPTPLQGSSIAQKCGMGSQRAYATYGSGLGGHRDAISE
jgi:hypothetical protein